MLSIGYWALIDIVWTEESTLYNDCLSRASLWSRSENTNRHFMLMMSTLCVYIHVYTFFNLVAIYFLLSPLIFHGLFSILLSFIIGHKKQSLLFRTFRRDTHIFLFKFLLLFSFSWTHAKITSAYNLIKQA